MTIKQRCLKFKIMKYIKVFDTAEEAVSNYRNADEKTVSAIQVDVNGTTHTFNYYNVWLDNNDNVEGHVWVDDTNAHLYAYTSVRNPKEDYYCEIFQEVS